MDVIYCAGDKLKRSSVPGMVLRFFQHLVPSATVVFSPEILKAKQIISTRISCKGEGVQIINIWGVRTSDFSNKT